MAYKIKHKGTPSKELESSTYLQRGMYSSLEIQGFRLFERMVLDDLSRINLFFGPNNSGKTSLLEAVYTHAAGLNFAPFQSQVVLRRDDNILTGPLDAGEKLLSVFHSKSSIPYGFTIAAKLVEDKSRHTLTSKFWPSFHLTDLDPRSLGQFSRILPDENQITDKVTFSLRSPEKETQSALQLPITSLGRWQYGMDGQVQEFSLEFPTSTIKNASPFKLGFWSDILSHRGHVSDVRVFSHLKRYGILDDFVKGMRSAFPEVREIDMIPYPDGSQAPIYVTTNDQSILPLYAFGDGMRRWFYILGNMAVYKNAAHCIEEIDSTFHKSSHPWLSRLLYEYAEKYNNQLFITSHSKEFVDSFLESFYGDKGIVTGTSKDPVRVYTIKRPTDSGPPDLWSLSGQEAYRKRIDYSLELRG